MKYKSILTGFVLVMLAYQAWRVYDYISGSLIGVSESTSFLVATSFLVFTEIGLLVWLHVAQPNATTDKQETVASAMILVDYIGSMILGLADLAKHNQMYVIDLSMIDPLLFFAPWLIVALNVGGYLYYTLNDSDAALERETRRLRHAEHQLEIKARTDAVMDLQANTEGIAKKLAPFYYQDIYNRVTGRTAAKFGRQAEKMPEIKITKPDELPTGEAIKVAESSNGRKEKPNGNFIKR